MCSNRGFVLQADCSSGVGIFRRCTDYREEWFQQWKGACVLSLYKKGDRSDCNNCT